MKGLNRKTLAVVHRTLFQYDLLPTSLFPHLTQVAVRPAIRAAHRFPEPHRQYSRLIDIVKRIALGRINSDPPLRFDLTGTDATAVLLEYRDDHSCDILTCFASYVVRF